MNLDDLNKRIDDSGYRKAYLAAKLGLTYQGLAYKLAGKDDFTVSEIIALSEALRLSKESKIEIFFNRKSE